MLRYINIKHKQKNIGIVYIKDDKIIVVSKDPLGVGKTITDYIKTLEGKNLKYITGESRDNGKTIAESTVSKDVNFKDEEYVFALADQMNSANLEHENERIFFLGYEEDDGEFEGSIFDFKLRHNQERPIGFNIFLEMVKVLDFEGYIPWLLNKLKHMIERLETAKDKYDKLEIAKAIFIAELVNNEFDLYLTSYFGNNFIGAKNWLHSDAFKERWKELKEERDLLYSRLVAIQLKIGEEKVAEIMRDYCGLITRHAFPAT